MDWEAKASVLECKYQALALKWQEEVSAKNILPFLRICFHLLLRGNERENRPLLLCWGSEDLGGPFLEPAPGDPACCEGGRRGVCPCSPQTGLEGRAQGGDALWTMTINEVVWAEWNTWEIPGCRRGGIWGRARFTGSFQIIWCGDRLGTAALPQGK